MATGLHALPRPVAVVVGAGGVVGAAHVGVGYALEERGFRSHVTSRGGVFTDRGLRRLLARGELPSRIEELTVPFTAVAMALDTGAAAHLDHGDLESALPASAAVPGMPPPVDRAGRTLVDGGVIAHVPVPAALRAGAASVVVVSSGPEVSPPRPHGRVRKVPSSARRAGPAASWGCPLWGSVPGVVGQTGLCGYGHGPRRSAGAIAARAGMLLPHHQIERDLHEVARHIPTVVLPTGIDTRPAPWDFGHSQRLIGTASRTAGRFLDGLRVGGPGLYRVDAPSTTPPGPAGTSTSPSLLEAGL